MCAEQLEVVAAMHSRWGAFARTGSPDPDSGAGGDGGGGVRWPRWEPEGAPHLVFDQQPWVQMGYKRAECAWWEEVLMEPLG